MRFWNRKSNPVQPRQVSTKQLELEAAKTILREVFRIQPAEVDDMIQQRLDERRWRETELWPATFYLGE
jgi:hypothetical protein